MVAGKVKPVSVALDELTVGTLDGFAGRWRCSRSQVVRFLAARADEQDPQVAFALDVGGGPVGGRQVADKKRNR